MGETILGLIFGLLTLLIPIAVLAGLGALIFLLVRGGGGVLRGGGRGSDGLTSRTLLRAYLRFAYLASLVIFLVGATFTLTAAFGSAFGHDFSYTPQSAQGPCGSGPPPGAPADAQGGYQSCLKAQGSQPAQKDNRQADSLILGISLLVAGLLIGSGHRVGQFALETEEERADSGLARTERLLATCGFGLVAIISVPTAGYQVLHYAILGTQAAGPDSGPSDPPGTALATALVFVVAWAYYLLMLIRRRDSRASATRPAAAAP